MSNIRLSERMAALARLASGGAAADIGTDHGFVPIFMVQNGLCGRAVLSDINEGPLKKAEENIAASGLDHKLFDLRLGGGLSVLEDGEVDHVIIAGMGGELIASILGEDIRKSRSFKNFVLQPRTRAEVLRRWLDENGYAVTGEFLVRERGRICQIIRAVPVEPSSIVFDNTEEPGECADGRIKLVAKSADGSVESKADEADCGGLTSSTCCRECFRDWTDYIYPPMILESEDPLAREYIQSEAARLKTLLERLSESRDPSSVEEERAKTAALLEKLSRS